MEKENKKRELMDATMKIVAENGLNNFSMKKVTDMVGVSETLIYRHFLTREKLLYLCFEDVHKSIAALFDYSNFDFAAMTKALEKEEALDQAPQSSNAAKIKLYSILHDIWMLYFNFLVNNGYRTLFYFEYRDSSFVRAIKEGDEEAKTSYFQGFVRLFRYFDTKYGILQKIGSDELWIYILDTTGIFARRTIRGELPMTKDSVEGIWKLLSGGIMGLLV